MKGRRGAEGERQMGTVRQEETKGGREERGERGRDCWKSATEAERKERRQEDKQDGIKGDRETVRQVHTGREGHREG